MFVELIYVSRLRNADLCFKVSSRMKNISDRYLFAAISRFELCLKLCSAVLMSHITLHQLLWEAIFMSLEKCYRCVHVHMCLYGMFCEIMALVDLCITQITQHWWCHFNTTSPQICMKFDWYIRWPQTFSSLPLQ